MLDALIGMGIFLLVLGGFFIAQSTVFLRELYRLEPTLQGKPIDPGFLTDPANADLVRGYTSHGDVVANAGLWSAIAGLLLLLVFTRMWKRDGGTAAVLGLKMPTMTGVLKWCGIFILLTAALSVLSMLVPGFHTDFMEKVMASSTDRMIMILGVGVVVPVFEEFLLRGLAYGALRHVADVHTSVAITAGLFTVMHLQYEPLVMLLILPMGVVLGYARANTGSIWVPVLMHMINNLSSIFLPEFG